MSEFLASEAARPFDLAQGPLLRAYLIKLAHQYHILLLNFHHIIADGWSFRVIMGELLALYSASSRGIACPLPEPMQYAEYARWQAGFQQSQEMATAEAYWHGQFADSVPVLDLPADHPRPTVQSFAGARQNIRIEPSLCGELKQLSARHGCTLFVTLLAGFKALLCRLSGQDDIVVGIPAAGQAAVGNESLVGYCVNLLPLRSQIDPGSRFTDYIARVKRALLDGYEHQIYPLIKLVKTLNIARDSSRPPIVAATFNLDRNDSASGSFDLDMELIANPTSSAKFDISLNITESDGALLVDCDYNTDLFEFATIRRWMGHFHTLLRGIVENPEQLISDLPILSQAERRQLLQEWNDSASDYPSDKTIHEMFEEQAGRSPQSIALVYEQEEVSYGELNRRANQLGHYLKGKGVGAEVAVGIMMERRVEMVVAILGVLKAGGAYVPIDPGYPEERVRYMLEDSKAAAVVTQEHLIGNMPEHNGHIIRLDTEWDYISQQSEANLTTDLTSENLAYIIYTSGTTGQPKGVLLSHRGVSNAVRWRQTTFSITEEDCILHSIPFAFDPSVWQLFGALLSGARLVISGKTGSRTSLI